MDYRFNADEWAKLTAPERVLRCRKMASEARRLAGSADPVVKKGFLSIAGDWETLASEIERVDKI